MGEEASESNSTGQDAIKWNSTGIFALKSNSTGKDALKANSRYKYGERRMPLRPCTVEVKGIFSNTVGLNAGLVAYSLL